MIFKILRLKVNEAVVAVVNSHFNSIDLSKLAKNMSKVERVIGQMYHVVIIFEECIAEYIFRVDSFFFC